MSKYDALKKYAAMAARPKYVKKSICAEVCSAMDAWKKDHFSPGVEELKGLSDKDFLATYKEHFYDTVEHEFAEAIEHIDRFMSAHDKNIFDYYNELKKYRALAEEDSAIDATAASTILKERKAAIY